MEASCVGREVDDSFDLCHIIGVHNHGPDGSIFAVEGDPRHLTRSAFGRGSHPTTVVAVLQPAAAYLQNFKLSQVARSTVRGFHEKVEGVPRIWDFRNASIDPMSLTTSRPATTCTGGSISCTHEV